ncbi:MAG TPA: hypothetical protein PK402_10510, partial [Tepidisphaeraceae bacterium]|nr:hypothetical protein [Tepidisphaeraceae bacterium]
HPVFDFDTNNVVRQSQLKIDHTEPPSITAPDASAGTRTNLWGLHKGQLSFVAADVERLRNSSIQRGRGNYKNSQTTALSRRIFRPRIERSVIGSLMLITR